MPDGTTTISHEERTEEHKRVLEAIFGGTLVGGLVAAAAAALSIIGLAGVYPPWLMSVATISLGVAFLFEGAAIMSRMSDLLSEVTENKVEMVELGTGTTGETLAGFAGVALGILALLTVVPLVLIPIAAIVFGVALILGAGATVRINELAVGYRQEHPIAHQIAREAVRATSGLQILAGLGAITLGIIALANIQPLILSLVAVLSLSATFLLTDTAIAGRMMIVLHHHR
jgi:hypothetical protein